MNPERLPVLATAVLVVIAGCEQTVPPPPPSEARDQQLVFVAGATFRMGSDEAELEVTAEKFGLSSVRPMLSEVPAHEATVTDFFIDPFTVTNQDFYEFIAVVPEWQKENLATEFQNGRYLEHWIDGEPAFDSLEHPVTFVTWHAASGYCEWRGKRLPTEAEFEWAAQGGSEPVEFPWGDEMPRDDLVNWGGNGIDMTVPVGSYPPNSRGLYDMSGNVWQFLADPWLGSYQQIPDSPAALTAAANDPGIRRVVRGGSFGANAANLRLRYRDSHRPYDAREMVGFRCARSTD